MASAEPLRSIIDKYLLPAFRLLPERMDFPEARVMLLAIGQQESAFALTRQVGGPAVGYWQFEKGGGVTGVLQHRATRDLAAAVCKARGIQPTPDAVYAALEKDQILAAAFARLLLWSDPAALPALGAVSDGWACYIRNWRPGKPRRAAWDAYYAKALAEVRS